MVFREKAEEVGEGVGSSGQRGNCILNAVANILVALGSRDLAEPFMQRVRGTAVPSGNVSQVDILLRQCGIPVLAMKLFRQEEGPEFKADPFGHLGRVKQRVFVVFLNGPCYHAVVVDAGRGVIRDSVYLFPLQRYGMVLKLCGRSNGVKCSHCRHAGWSGRLVRKGSKEWRVWCSASGRGKCYDGVQYRPFVVVHEHASKVNIERRCSSLVSVISVKLFASRIGLIAQCASRRSADRISTSLKCPKTAFCFAV